LLVVWLASGSPASAQQPWPLSVEPTLGASFGNTSGIYRNGGSGVFADLTIAAQLAAGNTGGFVTAFSVSMQGQPAYTTDCVLRSDYDGCVPFYPGFATVALAAGMESRTGRLRVLAGPARVSDRRDHALGLLGRVDAALPVYWRISLMASLRGAIVPDFRGDRFNTGAFSVGVRIR
jgi:hypothetical protein